MPATAVLAFRTFGAWLDHADVLGRGEVWASLSTLAWRTSLFRQVELPVVDVLAGVAPRVQVGASVPYARFDDGRGFGLRHVGDIYGQGKVRLLTAARGRLGVAVTPAIEILGQPDPAEGQRRVNGLAAVNTHVDRGAVRLHASGGWFTRGSAFVGGGLDVAVSPRLVVGGALTQMYSTRADPFSDALGLSRFRLDGSVGLSVMLTPRVVAFGSVGRTLRPHDYQAATFTATAGCSVNVRRSPGP